MGDVELMSSRGTLSNDPKTLGFDLSSGTKWIYPENYPKRDYQFSIVQTSLFHNTLVCLPTGKRIYCFISQANIFFIS